MLAPAYLWPSCILVLALTILFLAFPRTFSRPAWPSNAPRYLRGLPLLGSLDFFRCRLDFQKKSSATTETGNFSFFYGSHPIVSLSGADARKTFFTARGLDLTEGYDVPMPPKFTWPLPQTATHSTSSDQFYETMIQIQHSICRSSKHRSFIQRRGNHLRPFPVTLQTLHAQRAPPC